MHHDNKVFNKLKIEVLHRTAVVTGLCKHYYSQGED